MAAGDTPQQQFDEAMRLAAAARDWFDGAGIAARAALPPEARVTLAAESLRATTRLLEIVSALLVRQAGGEVAVRTRDRAPVVAVLDGPAREIVTSVHDLYLRSFAGAA